MSLHSEIRVRFYISSLDAKTNRTDLSCVTCKEVRLLCPEVLKRCFEGFVSSRNSLIIIFFLESDLVLFLRQFARKIVDELVESRENNLLSRLSVYKIRSYIFYRDKLLPIYIAIFEDLRIGKRRCKGTRTLRSESSTKKMACA